MLSYRMIDENILEVKEAIHSFTTTKNTFWYYDIKNWFKSSTGKENDINHMREMTQSDIDWVKKYYIPKVGI